MAEVRIGIDVGGTFTHAVALDACGEGLLAQVRVPTTHRAAEGVARGIVDALLQLLEEGGIRPQDVRFIAHSTTQATNALLEGDVAPVGIIGMGSGLEGRRARTETATGDIELAPGRLLKTYHRFLESSAAADRKIVATQIDELVREGAAVIVACQAFGVDDPSGERLVVEEAASMGIPATAGHEVSSLYGLRMRTRTSVVNASVLPRMMETARMTADSVRRAGITAPLMVMRSDGGVMSIEEMMRRPILTILSGPAAGVAAALIHARVSYGIFVEVGGTSTDISLITDGRPSFRTAVIGGHRLCLETVDVRTVGFAGGSMIRLSGTEIADIGPRSAHIAGLPYASFSELADDDWQLETFAPGKGDAADYVSIRASGGDRLALTPTCAARLLNGRGNRGLEGAWMPLADRLGLTPRQAAADVLARGCDRLVPVIEELIREGRLDRSQLLLVGGGGGAEAILPTLADALGMGSRLAENAPVISAIGVAVAMVRDVVERNMVNPGPEDLQRIRREAEAAAVRSGALPATVEVRIEIDQQRQIVRAVATGATEMRSGGRQLLAAEEIAAVARESLGDNCTELHLEGVFAGLSLFSARRTQRRLLGLWRRDERPVCVVDDRGIVRLRRMNASLAGAQAGNAAEALAQLLERETRYGDAGARMPGIFMLAGGRIADLCGLLSAEQIMGMAALETAGLDPGECIIFVIEKG